jgi:MT0933-like antitoxin protein
MGFLDRFKKAKTSAQGAVDKAQDVVEEHAPQVKEGIHKAADFVDEKTHGRFSGGIDKAEDTAESAVDSIADDAAAPTESKTESAPPSTPQQP